MNTLRVADPGASTALQPFAPMEADVYPIETVVHLTQIPRHQIAVYFRHGLIAPIAAPDQDGWWFDHEAIQVLRRIEGLRTDDGINLAGLRVIAELLHDRERLREEVRALRGPAFPRPKPGGLDSSR